VQRQDKRVRLFTRNGHDWSDRYSWIVDAARRLRQKQFVIDGEAVVGSMAANSRAIMGLTQSR
jgi:bifunctional non-homologous end joining protein LigD